MSEAARAEVMDPIRGKNRQAGIFTYQGYQDFLGELKRLGKTERFKDWKGGKVFLLRHDVDFSIGLAHKLAAIEKESGVVSTYFVLPTCDTYNVLCDHDRRLLREIQEMGHEIGLHFDPSLYPEDFQAAMRKEADILAFAVQEEIRSISLHNPSVHGQYPIFDGYINAYHPDIFSDENYISDSRMSFRGKDPYAWIEKISSSTVQILLHPMHYSDQGEGYGGVVCKAFLGHMNRIHDSFMKNSTYRKEVEEDFSLVLKRYLR